jgi:hypothetical protein
VRRVWASSGLRRLAYVEEERACTWLHRLSGGEEGLGDGKARPQVVRRGQASTGLHRFAECEEGLRGFLFNGTPICKILLLFLGPLNEGMGERDETHGFEPAFVCRVSI